MALPRPEEIKDFIAECALTDDQRATLYEGSTLYWAGPKRVDVTKLDEWRTRMADDLVIAAAQAIYANLFDPTTYPRFPWLTLHQIVGPLAPGEIWVIGARTGSGKTTIILNWISALLMRDMPFTMLALEQGPDETIRKLASLRKGVSFAALVRGEVNEDGLYTLNDEIRSLSNELIRKGVILLPERRLTITTLMMAMQKAAEMGHQIVIIDHIHRLELRRAGDEQTVLMEIMRTAKDEAVRLGLTVCFTAQLNRADASRLAPFRAPRLTDFRGSAVIEQESSVILGSWRPLQPITRKTIRAIEDGERDPRQYVIPHRMGTICMKHRRDEGAYMRQVRLHVRHGVIRDLTPDEEKESDTKGPARRNEVEKPRDLFAAGDTGDAFEGPDRAPF